MSNSATLFDSNSEDEERPKSFQINRSYADNYDKWRQGEELQKLKDRFGENTSISDSETSADDEYDEPDNPDFDCDFLRVLGVLHGKDSVKLSEDKFFKNNYCKKKKTREDKPMTLKDYERHVIMNRDGNFEDDEDSRQDQGSSLGMIREHLTFNEGHNKQDDSEDDGDGLLSSGLFKMTEKVSRETERQRRSAQTNVHVSTEMLEFVKGNKCSLNNKNDEKLLENLKDAWTNSTCSDSDKWLRDFFLNKRYLEEEDESVEKAYNEVVIDEETISEDEQTIKKMEQFDTKYRFRFEEPDEQFIKQYPRVIQDSLRPKKEKRKESRLDVRKRKIEEKKERQQQINKLKEIKLKEINEKLQQIKQVTGNIDINLCEAELNEEFDPAQHDATMARMFDMEYYDAGDKHEEKPVFDDDDIIENYDDWTGEEVQAGGGHLADSTEEEYVPCCEDENFNMDADYDPLKKDEIKEQMIAASSQRKRRRRSTFAIALAKNKPIFNPDEKKFEQYFDEYYKLDFEDIVAGIPCRFKYSKVPANNFGLEVQEILGAQDQELNRWCSLKKVLRHGRTENDEIKHRNNYTHRASLLEVKQQYFPSLFAEDQEAVQDAEEERKRKKNQQKKLRKQKKQQLLLQVSSSEINEDNEQTIKPEKKKKRKCIENLTTEEGSKDTTEEGSKDSANLKKAVINADFEDDIDRMEDKLLINEEGNKDTDNKSAFVLDNKIVNKKKRKSKNHEVVQSGGNCSMTKDPEHQIIVQGNKEKKKKCKKNVDLTEHNNDLSKFQTEDHDLLNKNKQSQEEEVCNSDNVGNCDLENSNLKLNLDQKSEGKIKKKRKKISNTSKHQERQKNNEDNSVLSGICDARLLAYWVNPKKVKNKLIYCKKA